MPCSVFEFWCNALVPEDVYVALKLLKDMYPEDYSKGIQFFGSNIFYPCNMFICKKEIFDAFAKWQFTYLEELRKKLKISSYSRERRILGFIGEGLLPLYFFNREFRIKTLPVVSFLGGKDSLWTTSMKTKLKARITSLYRKPDIHYDPTLLAGLRVDGILDKENNISHNE